MQNDYKLACFADTFPNNSENAQKIQIAKRDFKYLELIFFGIFLYLSTFLSLS